MCEKVDLVRTILGDRVASDAEARLVLDAAASLHVDPLALCASRFGLGQAEVAARAARWLGTRSLLSVPLQQQRPLPDATGAVPGRRTLRGVLDGERVLFAAPHFCALAGLAAALRTDPSLRQRLVLTTPAALCEAVADAHSEALTGDAANGLERGWPEASAQHELTLAARLVFAAAAIFLCVMVTVSAFVHQAWLLPLVGALLVAPALLRLIAVATALPAQSERASLPDAALPVYSVLVPLRDEAAMVPLLREALLALDYPREKLDVIFVVESRSAETVAAVRSAIAGTLFQLVVVPDSRPRTKPKALNFALPLVRGSHVVVYDAEDIPHPRQLRLVASEFAARPDVDCLQAELVVDNARESWLAAMFAGEYAGQFGLMLPALARWRLPLPLGGTSNHFRTSVLRAAGAWDAFNVTEDADLGIRLSRLRRHCGTVASQTREEAPVTFNAWLAQRTRWTKGWLLTFIVHNRHPRALLRDLGWRRMLAFEIYVGGLILSAPLHTIFLVTSLIRLALSQPLYGGPGWWLPVFGFVLFFGYGGAVTIVLAGLVRLKQPILLFYQFLLPIYWVLHCAATWQALWEMLSRPYAWSKTTHGQTAVVRQVATSKL